MVSAAEGTLREMLGLAWHTASTDNSLDPHASWDVFKSFAARAVAADPPERLESDDLLFQWDAWSVDFTRQFTIADAHGDYDRMEQLHLTFWFEETKRAEPGIIWSIDQSLDAWINEVEQAAGFDLLATAHAPLRALVEQERV